MKRTHLALVAALALLAGCADLKVQVQYAPDAKIDKLAAGAPVTVFRFADARGNEGDKGDSYRVGGVYNGYGMRLSKILHPTPWPEMLARDLGAGFTQRGVQTVVVEERMYAPGSAVTTPLVLTGEIRNFSTENRWAGYLAHVSGIVRLYDQSGAKLIEKPVSARLRPNEEEVQLSDGRLLLERLLNRAVSEFVRQVVTDPDLTQRLMAAR
jgi:hypothetical protein